MARGSSDPRRFETAFRGYATDEVDAYLDRVGRRLAELAAENEELTRRLAAAESERDAGLQRLGALEAELAGTVVSLRAAEAETDAVRAEAARRVRLAQQLLGAALLEAARRRRIPSIDVPPPPVGLRTTGGAP